MSDIIFISHRGNLEGPNPAWENSTGYIDRAISKGYDVEIDLRSRGNSLWLGHDFPEYKISMDWLKDRKENLWIHVKDYGALVAIVDSKLRYFCHEKDTYTLTSNGYVWSHDLTNKMNDRCIVPLLSSKQVASYNQRDFYAVCSDYIYECEEKFND